MKWKNVDCECPQQDVYYLTKCDEFKIDGEKVIQKLKFSFCTFNQDKNAWTEVFSQTMLSTLEYSKYISLEDLNNLLSD